MRETCKRQDQTDFHHTGDYQCHIFSRSDGQCTTAKVVSDRLKTDLVTWNSLSYLENVKGTCHCYCERWWKQGLWLFAGDRDTSGGKWAVPEFFFSMLLSWVTLPSESEFFGELCVGSSPRTLWFCLKQQMQFCFSVIIADAVESEDSPAHFHSSLHVTAHLTYLLVKNIRRSCAYKYIGGGGWTAK